MEKMKNVTKEPSPCHARVKKGNALSLISRIREKANRFIIRELENHGIKGIVPSLVKYDFVEREKSCTDSRVTYIKLTNKGLELRPIFEDISKKINALLYGGFTDEEPEIFETLLHKVNSQLDKKK